MSKQTLISVCILIIFLTGVLFLTFNSENIFKRTLPIVTTVRLELRSFENNSSNKATAIPSDVINDGYVFTVEKIYYNGEYQNAAKKTRLTTGAERDGYTEVISGIDRRSVIISGYYELNDGDIVFIRS